MRYELPLHVKQSLADPAMRLHHLLWHAIRDSWHGFTPEERETLRRDHPAWVPNHARFVSVPATPQNPFGLEINPEAGESFLYMHRRMIEDVDRGLQALGEPALIPWPEVPDVADPDYPVPDRNAAGPPDDPKSDAHLAILQDRARQVRDPEVLRSIPLATLGAFVETLIHDSLHMRWAGDPGEMADFPDFDPSNPDIVIPERFHPHTVDWLGAPYSSHVNSTFWKLHGWVDRTIEHWREANGLERIEWIDTWRGAVPEEDAAPLLAVADTAMPAHGSGHGHGHGGGHGHHSVENLMTVFRTINGFEECHASFGYALEHRVGLPSGGAFEALKLRL